MQLLSHQSLCDLYSLLWFLNTSTMQYYHLQVIAKYLGGKKFHKRNQSKESSSDVKDASSPFESE